jgi:hypothetical protein
MNCSTKVPLRSSSKWLDEGSGSTDDVREGVEAKGVLRD